MGWLVEPRSADEVHGAAESGGGGFQVRDGPAPVGGLVFVHVDPVLAANSRVNLPTCSAVSASLFRVPVVMAQDPTDMPLTCAYAEVSRLMSQP